MGSFSSENETRTQEYSSDDPRSKLIANVYAAKVTLINIGVRLTETAIQEGDRSRDITKQGSYVLARAELDRVQGELNSFAIPNYVEGE